jgi:hypothetical protein
MIKKNLDENKLKGIENETSTRKKNEGISKDNDNIGFNNLNSNNKTKNIANKEITNSINKKDSEEKNNPTTNNKNNKLNKNEKGIRRDRSGNEIFRGGKYKVTFIDKVTNKNFSEVIKVENYKEYNKMEEPSSNRGNGCCSLI